MKRCGGCGVEKPLDQFPRSTRNKDGRGSRCSPCNVAQVAAWRAANPDARRRELLATYGLTLEQYDALYDAQAGCCALCARATVLVVDHDHATGEVRGLLCRGCNAALGRLGDTAERIHQVLEYLE